MARKNTLEIVVKGTDKASPVLRGVGQAMGGLGTAARYALTGIGVAAAGTLASVTALGVGLTKLAIDAAPLEGIQAAFEGITGGGERMLAQLREQSAHMITDRELMKSYNLAAQLVGRQFADKLPTAMRYLTKVAAATGQSMDYMMDSLVRGVGRASPLILDNLGVQVDLTRAYEKQAVVLGKNVDQLTKAEQQAAVMNEVMEQLARNTEKMPDVTGSASAGLASLSTAFANAKDEIGAAFMPALKAVLTLFDELRPMFQQAVTWVADLVRGWASGFATLIANAATWGANIVESLASGISGSNAIVRALRNVANTITSWLAPGSPPKLLPDLPDWGAGALDAWLSGWTGDTLLWSQLAQNLRGNLKPFLEGIDLGKGIDEGALRDVFQADAPTMRRYLRAYEGVGRAVAELKDAREELAEAEESGDEEAIEAARGRVKAAEDAEYSARRAFNAEERRLEMRISAEAQIARAVTETAKVQSDAAAAAIRQAELQYRLAVAGTSLAQMRIWREELAKATAGTAEYWQIMTRLVELPRTIAQAHLQYRLAVAQKPLAQVSIWEEELAKAEEDSAEWWQIQTRIVQLRQQAAKEAGGAAADGFSDGLEEEGGKAGGGLVEKIDWKGIGGLIGEAIRIGIQEQFRNLAERLGAEVDADGNYTWRSVGAAIVRKIGEGALALSMRFADVAESFRLWSESDSAQEAFRNIGYDIASTIIAGIKALFTKDENGVSLLGALAQNLGRGMVSLRDVWINIGLGIGTGIADGVWEGFTGKRADPEVLQKFQDQVGEAIRRALELGSMIIPRPQSRGAVPGYAEGGIVTRPTLAMIGERGPEAVVPLDRMGTTNNYDITIPIDARGADAREVERGVLRGLRAAGIPVAP